MVETNIKPVRFFCPCISKINDRMGPSAIFTFNGIKYYVVTLVTNPEKLLFYKAENVVFAEVEFPDPKNLTAKSCPRLIRWVNLEEELKPKTE